MRTVVRPLSVLPIGFVMMGLFVGCDGITIPTGGIGNVNGNVMPSDGRMRRKNRRSEEPSENSAAPCHTYCMVTLVSCGRAD